MGVFRKDQTKVIEELKKRVEELKKANRELREGNRKLEEENCRFRQIAEAAELQGDNELDIGVW